MSFPLQPAYHQLADTPSSVVFVPSLSAPPARPSSLSCKLLSDPSPPTSTPRLLEKYSLEAVNPSTNSSKAPTPTISSIDSVHHIFGVG